MRTMTVVEARNDLVIETVELINRFPFYAKAVDAAREADKRDAEKMILLAKEKSTKARRQAQSGVDPDLSAIERELAKLGHNVLIERDRWGAAVLGSTISFKEQWSSGNWGRPTGKFSLYVDHGFAGEKKRFPQKADGTFSYAKVAQQIVDNFEAAQAQTKRAAEAAAKKASSAELVEQLRAEFGLSEYDSRFKASRGYYADSWRHRDYREVPADQGKVWMDLGTPQVTPEQARVLMATLKELGLVK